MIFLLPQQIMVPMSEDLCVIKMIISTVVYIGLILVDAIQYIISGECCLSSWPSNIHHDRQNSRATTIIMD